MKKTFKMMRNHYQGYKDEMIATGVVLAIGVVGTFFVLSQVKPIPKPEEVSSENQQVLGAQTDTTTNVQPESETGTPIPTLTPIPTPPPTPTPQVVIAESTPTATQEPEAEYLVADDKEFENDKYILSLKNVRMYIKGSIRTFKVNVVLANKSASEGLPNRLTVAIVKDGNEIASSAYMSISEAKTVKPGEKITYSASISLIAGTDVEKLMYHPTADGVDGVEYQIIK